MKIEHLTEPVSDDDVIDLARLLVDAVESGAAVSFLAPFNESDAVRWWQERLRINRHQHGATLVARASGRIVGCVLLQPAWAPNQPHRAEVEKLLVLRQMQRRGIGDALVQAVEEFAGAAGFSLLTLDARAGGDAERLYQRRGWNRVGVIPDFALNPDGKQLHDAVLYYKHLKRQRPASTD